MPGHCVRFAATPESAHEMMVFTLFALPARLAFFEEGADAFGGVLGERVHGEACLQVFDRLLERHVAHRVPRAAAEAEDRRALGRELLRERVDGLAEFRARHDLIRPAETLDFGAADLVAGEQELEDTFAIRGRADD